jgi:hypothetical protein
MKRNVLSLAALVLAAAALLMVVGMMAGWVQAGPLRQAGGAPGVVSYQGQVLVSDQPYDGTGYFKFAVVDAAGTTTYWSNDGTSSGGGEPTASVSLTVSEGLFSLLLGDTTVTGMSVALDESVFSDPDTYLRVWFSEDDLTFTQLPDQKIASVPYALQAQSALEADTALQADSALQADEALTADDADTLDGLEGADYQLLVTGSCPVGYAVRQINSDGSVLCEVVTGKPVHSLTVFATTGNDGKYNAVTIGSDGLGLISYQNATGDLMVAHCLDQACTQVETSTLDTSTSVGEYSSIAIGQDGLGLIAYSTVNGLSVAHCQDLACASAVVQNVYTSGKIRDIAITIGADGLGLISGYHANSSAIRVFHCMDVACNTAANYGVYSGSTGYQTGIAIGRDGLGLISFFNSGDLYVAHCNNALCSSSSRTNLYANGGQYSSLTIGSDGYGLVAFKTLGNDLGVLHCDNLTCSTATTTLVDNTTDAVGEMVSLSIGSDGLGMISYQDMTHDVLKTAHCRDLLCSSADLVSFGSIIPHTSTSITIGMDGFPLISFVGDSYDLNTMHCSNVACIPYYRSR